MKKFLYVYLATAGIGRMSFGAWVGEEKIDRSDGDDDGTHVSLVDALEDAGKRIEEQLLQAPWRGNKLRWGTPTVTSLKGRGDVQAIVLTFDGRVFQTALIGDEHLHTRDDMLNYRTAEGATPSEALKALGKKMEARLAHARWVDEQGRCR